MNVIDYKKIELYGKPLIHKLVLKPPFEFAFPNSDYACFLFSLKGNFHLHVDEDQIAVPANYSLFLNCITTGKKISNTQEQVWNEIVVINFHPDILKRIYERELPFILQQPRNKVTNQSSEKINNDFLIQKYIEGLLFYFENPSLVNDEILILKLK